MEENRKNQKNEGQRKSAGKMKPQMVDEIKGKVLDAVVGQKMYRDSNLSAQKLSEALGTNTRYVSLVINAEFGMNYSTFIHGLKASGIDLNRKMLSEIAVADKAGFAALCEKAKAAL